MQEEFKNLISLLTQTYEGKGIKLDEVLQQTLGLFDNLKSTLKDATPEQKQEMIKSMNEMYTKLSGEAKKFSEKSGLSEEQLYAASENPANYTPEQWKSMQDAKSQLLESTKQISRTIQSDKTGQTAHSPSPDHEKKLHHKVKKDKWVRS